MKKSVAESRPDLVDEWDDERSIHEFTSGMGYRAKWKCSRCGRSWGAEIKQRVKGSGCPRCARGARKGDNDLATLHPELAKEWVEETMIPSEVTAGMKKKVQWKCGDCQNTYTARISHRVRGSGCPYCSGRKVIEGVNDLETLCPDLAQQWSRDNEKLPSEVGKHSHYAAKWKCNQCGHSWKLKVQVRVNTSYDCQACDGVVAVSGKNDVGTLFPRLAAEWNDERDIGTFFPSSHTRVSWKCSECSYEWGAGIRERAESGHRCPRCVGKVRAPGVSDLATVFPERVNDWNDERDIRTVAPYSQYEAKWKCPEGHEVSTKVSVRVKFGCTICSGKRVLRGVNDLETLHPNLAAEWDFEGNEKHPQETHPGSHYVAFWLCPENSQHRYIEEVRRRVSGVECKLCFPFSVSKAESELTEYVRSLGFDVRKDRKVLEGKEMDLYIPSEQLAFEFNGTYWHSDDIIRHNHGISAREYHESKRNLAREKGVVLFFVWEDDWYERRGDVETTIRDLLAGVIVDTSLLEKLVSSREACAS